ncbi:MAG: hypothetical protein B7X65_17020 [Polaromonas sp. 39-63-25]|nr:MAG: hypothetical protein B7Y09_17820 [Polaromonas sp. 24-63-21]OZA51235.1 MAG: hypothetical protein B7X88_06310 [Polaromonas sp. 17-63-33]OZA86438.1 MAG: hypothetical protein B7X65_17020 [Polaromonas sp. 39-63-25]
MGGDRYGINSKNIATACARDAGSRVVSHRHAAAEQVAVARDVVDAAHVRPVPDLFERGQGSLLMGPTISVPGMGKLKQGDALTTGRTGVGIPASSAPCTAKTFLARSIPAVTIAVIPLPGQWMKSLTSSSWRLVAVTRKSLGSRFAWDGEVPFIR